MTNFMFEFNVKTQAEYDEAMKILLSWIFYKVVIFISVKTKITIKKDSPTAEVFMVYMAEKEVFRKAAEAGKAEGYAEQQPEKFAQPIQLVPA